jgi:hypothetical protein
MADRQRQRVGRSVAYFPTDAEAATGNDDVDAVWDASITGTNPDGTVNLHIKEGDGGTIAKLNVERSNEKGGFSFTTPEAP